MNGFLKRCSLLAVLLGFSLPPLASAQTVTTSALSGVVSDESGGVLPGASVEAIHEPTGSRYSAVTGGDGRYAILNVRAGGPYVITVTMSGFQPLKQSGITVTLGDERAVPFKLKVSAISETIEVTSSSSIIGPSATGPAANVSQKAIEEMPTVSRSIVDMARLSPHFTPVGGGDGSGADVLSVGARSARYNNIQIDGANNNDLFALASNSGNPGGGTGTQPISFDAIQEIQLVVAPYDVRQGGFSGGGVNAITRSGTNRFAGTAFYEFRTQSLVGDSADRYSETGVLVTPSRALSDFSEKQFGASFGGPIVKDKAFFFVNYDGTRNKTPAGWSADGSSGQTFTVPRADLDAFLSIMKNTYGYDPGAGQDPLAEFTRETPSNKFFARLDFNLSDRHRLTIRNNLTKPQTDVGFPSNSRFLTPDDFYTVQNRSNSIVAQLNSTFSNTSVNELRINYQKIQDMRGGPTAFPQVLVDLTGGTCGSSTCQIRSGRETFSTANELYQDVIELTDDYTMHRGKHVITIGTHNEFFKFKNLFIRDNFGSYRFSSLANFAAGLAQQYDHSFSATSDPKQAAEFNVNQFGFYAGDTWRAASHFTLSFGLRVDIPTFPDTPTANPAAVANFGYATDITPKSTLWSPRAGFNWDVKGDSKQQIRGGVGVFSGRPPYVWISNQFGNTGVDFTRIGASFNANNRIPFVPNPAAQPQTVTGAAAGTFTNEIDVIDPDFKYPQVLRTNLAYDRDLGLWGMLGTVEGLYGKTLQDIDYKNLNFVDSGARRTSDGRPVMVRKNTTYSDVIYLGNTTEGSSYTVSAKLQRPMRDRLAFSASWLYGHAESVNDGGSDQAASNYANNYIPGNPNEAPLSDGRFSPGHRINAAVQYDFKLGKSLSLLVGGYYNGQTGRPFTLLFLSDVNNDTKTSNDLVFIPSSADQVIFTNGTFAQFDAYINNDPQLAKWKGQIMPRNAARGPRTNLVELSTALRVPFGSRSVEFRADMQNVLNLLNKDWGQIDFPPFNDIAPIGVSVDAATGKYVYNLATINNPNYIKFNRDDLRSRWQMAFTARVRF